MATNKGNGLSVGSIVGLIFAAIYGLQSVGILPFPLPLFGSNGISANYYPALAVLVGVLSALWIGYKIALWQVKKTVESKPPDIAQKPEVTQPASPIHLEAGTTMSITSVSREPLDLTSLQTHSRGLEVYTRAEVEQEYPFESFVSQVKHGGELVLMVGAFSVARYKPDVIKRLITEKNVTVTILLLAPTIPKKVDDGIIDEAIEIERDFKWKGLIADIQQTLTLLCTLRKELKELRNHLIIRTYDRTPILSMIVIHPNTEGDSIMQVGTYLSGTDASARFQIILSKKASENVFKKYWAEYELIHDKHSHEINYKKIESEFLS